MDLIERYEVIDLPRREYDMVRILFYLIFTSIFFIILSRLIQLGGLQFLYGNIIFLTFFIINMSGFVTSLYLIINSLFIQHPILIISPRHIYLGVKHLSRSPVIYDTRINTTHDMRLDILQESRSGKFRVILEERIIIDLGLFTNLDLAQQHRLNLRSSLSKFYPELFISVPLYKKI